MNDGFQYVELSFINSYEEIKKQIINTVAISFLIEKGFKETTLNSYLENTQYGFTASANQTGTHRLLRITDIISGEVNWENVPKCECDSEERYLLNKGDILVARTGGTTGKSYLINSVPSNAIFASYLIRLRVKKNNLPEFVNIFLNSYVFWSQIAVLKSGSAQPNVNAEKLKTLIIPECSPKIQNKIIEALNPEPEYSTDDFTVSLKRKINAAIRKLDQLEFLRTEFSFQQTYLQQLRQVILQEAVQGKLSELRFSGLKDDKTSSNTQKEILQSSNPTNHSSDEDAATLLQRIKAEKQKLLTAGKLKKEKELPPISEDEIPFELPNGWVWCRLGEVCLKIGSGSTPRGGREVYTQNGVKFIRSQNVYNQGLIFNHVAYIDADTHKKMAGTKVIPNDILLNITGGSIGRCALIPNDFDEANVSQHVTIVRTVSLIDRHFIHQLMISPYFQDYIMTTQTGGNREGLAKKNMELMLIPLPPLSEQHRIVTKLRQLLQMVNQLEQQVQQSQTQAQQLLQAVLKEAFSNKEKGYEENELVTMAAEE